MRLAIFDLDDTLIDGDSASLFCRYLVEQRLSGPELLSQEAELMQTYRHGVLDMAAYIRLTTAPLRNLPPEALRQLSEDFVARCVRPRHFAQAQKRIQQHRQAGDLCLVISATADFIVQPAAQALGIEQALAIELERDQAGFLTGHIQGIPSFREGQGQTPPALAPVTPGSRLPNPVLQRFQQRSAAAGVCRPPARGQSRSRTCGPGRQRDWPVLHWMRATETTNPPAKTTGEQL